MEERSIASSQRTNLSNSHFRSLDLPFTLKNTEIDYFHVSPEIIGTEEFNVSEVNVNLRNGEYLNLERHFQCLEDGVNETIVLNIPVGHGKTTLCYELIKKYHEEGYNIIVCSPFQKLVEKDYAALRAEMPGALIYNYKELDFATETWGGSFSQHLAEEVARIHIMTINCLLKNPGDDKFEQAFHKSRFLQRLKNTIRNRGGKVVFFFDEIHESVGNFKNEFIPNLASWRDITYKCFVSSATFTSASIPVIRYISYLTLATIKIFFTPRRKARRQANLHLHITSSQYSPGNLFPLGKIPQIINSTVNAGGKVNILCAYRSIVNALVNSRSENAISRSILSLNPNVCTSDTENEFNPNANNVGTNFKTGVNITESNATLILIMPIVNKSNPFASYGIFSDGIPAIIQSLARLRNGGNIHVFMYMPDTILELDEHVQNIPPQLIQNKRSRAYKSVNESYGIIRQKYDSLKRYIQSDIDFLSETLNGYEELKYHYPTFQEVLIEKSQSYLLSKHEWMGKHISPYLLWASINDQFCNATLTSIHYHEKNFRLIDLMAGTESTTLISLLSDEQKSHLISLSLSEGFIQLPVYLSTSKGTIENEDGHTNEVIYTNQFNLDGQTYGIEKIRHIGTFKAQLIKLLTLLKTGLNVEVTKGIYIRTCLKDSETLTNPDELGILYKNLNELKTQFLSFLQSQSIKPKEEYILHKDYYVQLPDAFVQNAIRNIYALKDKDKILTTYFSFFQKHTEGLKIENIDVNTKKTIVAEFEGLFALLGARRTYQGKKNEYYLIPENAENQSHISNANFIS